MVSYLSGGVDSSLVVAMAGKVLGRPIPTFTIRIDDDPKLDERARPASSPGTSAATSRSSSKCGHEELLDTYPELIRAAEAPVIDTSCAALLLLAREVHHHGYKVALTGEGADEWLAGYPWYKINRARSGCSTSSPACRCRLLAPASLHGLQRHAAVFGSDSWHEAARRARRPQRLARHLRPDEPVEAAASSAPRCCERLGDHVPTRTCN